MKKSKTTKVLAEDNAVSRVGMSSWTQAGCAEPLKSALRSGLGRALHLSWLSTTLLSFPGARLSFCTAASHTQLSAKHP